MMSTTLLSQHVKTHLRASQLILSPHNVRQTPHSTGYLEELASSIKSGGLMHAITVHPMSKKQGQSFYGVCAGGGRYAAIQLLVSRGDIDDERDLVECNLIEEKEAIHLSLAENVHREPLHPADEYEGFKRMIDAGESVEDIAAAFGVSPVVVQRRLRLANVDPSFIALFRAGDIKLDQLMALAMTTDPALQCRVWQALPDYNRSASRIRAAVVGEKVDVARSPLVQFVGIDAYTEAGGVVEQDLFAQQDKSGFIVDVPLLESLARVRLDAVAEHYREEGWGWVTVCLDGADVDQHQYSRAPFARRESTDEEKARLDDIKRELDALYDHDEDDLSDEASELLDALNEEHDTIRDAHIIYTDAVKAAAGVIVTVQQDGLGIEIIAGLVRPEDRKKVKTAVETDVSPAAVATKKDGELPESMVRRLTAHRTRAIQAVLSQRGDVALALLVCRLALPVFYKGTLGATCLGLRLDRPALERDADDIMQCAASSALVDRHKQLKHTLPKKGRDLFPWLLKQPQDQLIALLGFCLAEGIDTVQSHATRDEDIEALMRALDIDMADWWQATAASYFKFVKKDDTLAVLKEACSSSVAQKCVPLKKSELVGAAEAAVRDARWLPPLLRRKVTRKARQ